MGTQIGADGERYPTGSAPTEYTPRNLRNRLTAIEGTAIEAWSNPQADMVAGAGYADEGDNITCGFVIPDTWTTFEVSILWGIWGDPGTLGDISFALLADFGGPGLPLPSPAFVGAATVAEEDITIGYMNQTVLAADVQVEDEAALYSVTANRAANLLGGTSDTELQPYADADTSVLNAYTGGLFAVIFTPTNIIVEN